MVIEPGAGTLSVEQAPPRPRTTGLGRRTLKYQAAAALVVVALVLAGCSSSSGVSSGGSVSGSTAPAGMTNSNSGPTAPARDIGITATQIKLAVVADVQTSINPGLFQKTVDIMKAWAQVVNEEGGIAGRKVVIDAIDSKHDANTSRNAVIRACSDDFALVGTEALLLSDMTDIDNCKNSNGDAVGIPNLAGLLFGPVQQCDKFSFGALNNDPAFCAHPTASGAKHTVQVGDYKWLASHIPDLHGIWVYNSDVPTAKAVQVPVYVAGAQAAGIKQDGQGFYGAAGGTAQSALTPIVQVIKQNHSSYVNDGVTPPSLVQLRQEAQLQGVTSVKAWVCSAGCYAQYFLDTGGSAVEGTYQTLNTIPFFSEYGSFPELKKVVDKLGGVDKIDANAVSAYVEALLFQDAVQKVVSKGHTLSRKTLFEALSTDETAFDAGGIIGRTNVSKRAASPCFAIAQVKDGKWQRAYPAKPGAFDCSSGNLTEAASTS